MATGTLRSQPRLFESRRGRVVLENLTAYLFLAPAGIIIFIFGLFPVGFAFFVSLHQWRRFPGEYRGLDSYVKAVGSFAYVGFFWLSVGFILFGAYMLYRLWRQTRAEPRGLVYVIPGAASAVALTAFVNWFFTLLPFVLNVPVRLRGQAITRKLFIEEFFNSFRFEAPLDGATYMWLSLLAGLVLSLTFIRQIRTQRSTFYLALGMFAFTAFIGGGALLRLTLHEIDVAIEAARENSESLPVWSYIIFISAGFGLIFAAYRVWKRAASASEDRNFALSALAAVLLVVGGVLLAIELPQALGGANRDVKQGFNVTVMYAAVSVPFQLSLGLGLAVLLFQNIRGKSFFRMIYFLPYITPFAATSVIFTLLFSHRSGSPANQLLDALGIPTQIWLQSPRGILQVIFGSGIPDELAGPSLALTVIILYNVWVYAGYSAVIFLAGLGGIPREMYEAAKIDGASGWQQFRFVTLPMLSPTTFFLTLIATIGTFQAFTQIYLLRQAGAYRAVDTINIYIYQELTSSAPDYAYGSAMAFVLFAVILILTLIQNRVAERRVFYG